MIRRLLPVLVVLTSVLTPALAGAGIDDDAADARGREGVTLRRDGTSPGYTLIAPSESTTTYLVDLDGKVVHEWEAKATPGLQVELLPNGELLRPAKTGRETRFAKGNGWGGTVQTLDRDGDPTWTFEYANDDHIQHHDVELLPNGNVLLLAWEHADAERGAGCRSRSEARESGRSLARAHRRGRPGH